MDTILSHLPIFVSLTPIIRFTLTELMIHGRIRMEYDTRKQYGMGDGDRGHYNQ